MLQLLNFTNNDLTNVFIVFITHVFYVYREQSLLVANAVLNSCKERLYVNILLHCMYPLLIAKNFILGGNS